MRRPERRRRSGRDWIVIAALAFVGLLVLAAVFADVIAYQSPYEQDLGGRLEPPVWAGGSWSSPLGTDQLGRDVLIRIIYGARISLVVAVVALAVGGGIGLVVGVSAGYFGGWLDRVVMRITDATFAIPTIFLAIVFAVTLGPSLRTVILAISAVIWSRFARIMRAEALRVRGSDFVALARAAGCTHLRILVRHILPNVLNTWVVLLSLELGAVIVVEAILGFLGAGVPPPTPSWGGMIAEGRQYISSAWWLSALPGVTITLVVLSFNVLGDALRDRLDPRRRQVAMLA
jgi:peptide/nickel transport system permease protein